MNRVTGLGTMTLVRTGVLVVMPRRAREEGVHPGSTGRRLCHPRPILLRLLLRFLLLVLPCACPRALPGFVARFAFRAGCFGAAMMRDPALVHGTVAPCSRLQGEPSRKADLFVCLLFLHHFFGFLVKLIDLICN